jgi:hypothetical protein
MNSTQLQRVTELNAELITCVTRILRSIDDYTEKHHILIPTDPKIEYLVEQVLCLISEINADHSKSDGFTQGELPDKDYTEPFRRLWYFNITAILY